MIFEYCDIMYLGITVLLLTAHGWEYTVITLPIYHSMYSLNRHSVYEIWATVKNVIEIMSINFRIQRIYCIYDML